MPGIILRGRSLSDNSSGSNRTARAVRSLAMASHSRKLLKTLICKTDDDEHSDAGDDDAGDPKTCTDTY